MFVVVYDACVLYPAPLRDFLVHLATTGLFSAKWTNQIHDEWISNLRRKRPDLELASLERTRKLMDDAVEDCLVTGNGGPGSDLRKHKIMQGKRSRMTHL